MKYTFTIDIPSLYNAAKNKHEISLVVSCLKAVMQIKDYELAMSKGFFYNIYDNDLFCLLDKINIKSYDSSVKKNNLTSVPDVIKDIEDPMLNDEQYLLCCYLHSVQPKGNGVFVVHSNRWNNYAVDMLKTIKDKKSVDHRVLLSDTSSFDAFVKDNWPKFVQHKHGQKGYTRAGKAVSPFTADQKKGEELLRKAYAEAEIPEDVMFPDRLYTWNDSAKTYVEFRRSSADCMANEYHGFDLDKKYWKDVPENIKEIHHHWK